jgi:exonuclease VII large subunit
MRRNRFIDLHRRLVASPGRLLENARHRFRHMEGILRVLGPDATLRRGYSITMNERGKIIAQSQRSVHRCKFARA